MGVKVYITTGKSLPMSNKLIVFFLKLVLLKRLYIDYTIHISNVQTLTNGCTETRRSTILTSYFIEPVLSNDL